MKLTCYSWRYKFINFSFFVKSLWIFDFVKFFDRFLSENFREIYKIGLLVYGFWDLVILFFKKTKSSSQELNEEKNWGRSAQELKNVLRMKQNSDVARLFKSKMIQLMHILPMEIPMFDPKYDRKKSKIITTNALVYFTMEQIEIDSLTSRNWAIFLPKCDGFLKKCTFWDVFLVCVSLVGSHSHL